jgi:D-aminoacyl-tRNA deacylase
MKVVLQRVSRAEVKIAGAIHNAIDAGLLVFLGIEDTDDAGDIDWLVNKIVGLRIFNDEAGVMNVNVKDINGEILIISQFTLHAQTKKGNRPSYIKAAKPDLAIPLYEEFVKVFSAKLDSRVKTGIFGANMQIALENDGPVTIIIDTKNKA